MTTNSEIEEAELRERSIATQKIRSVIFIFRIVAWPFFVLFGLMVAGGAATAVFALVTGDFKNFWVLLGGTLLFAVLTMLFYSFIKTATRMERKEFSAANSARLLCIPLLFGFPLFTIVSLMCMSYVSKYYPRYCEEL